MEGSRGRGFHKSLLSRGPESGRCCGPDHSDLEALRPETSAPNMTVGVSTAVAVAQQHGGSGGATMCVPRPLTGVAQEGALRNAHVPVSARGEFAVAEDGPLLGGSRPLPAAEEVAVVGRSRGDASSSDGHAGKEVGTEKRSCVVAGSRGGASMSSLSPVAAGARSCRGGGAARGAAAVAAAAGSQTPLKGGHVATDDFGGEQCREVVARVPLCSRGERPAFVVVGLVGEVGDRVLLLPTLRRRCETVGESPALSGESRAIERTCEHAGCLLCVSRCGTTVVSVRLLALCPSAGAHNRLFLGACVCDSRQSFSRRCLHSRWDHSLWEGGKARGRRFFFERRRDYAGHCCTVCTLLCICKRWHIVRQAVE